jgi:hypothetical protein
MMKFSFDEFSSAQGGSSDFPQAQKLSVFNGPALVLNQQNTKVMHSTFTNGRGSFGCVRYGEKHALTRLFPSSTNGSNVYYLVCENEGCSYHEVIQLSAEAHAVAQQRLESLELGPRPNFVAPFSVLTEDEQDAVRGRARSGAVVESQAKRVIETSSSVAPKAPVVIK